MGKSSGQKLKLICILDILKRYSDEENPLNATEICNYLSKAGIEAERKAIYNDIELLTDYGYDIVKCAIPKRGCFLAEREFEIPEIYLLSDAVRAAKFISPKKTRELVSKLDSMLSVNQVKKREKRIFFDLSGKCANEEVYYNIDAISRAIEERKKIRFDYSVRRLTNDREITAKTKEMIISPYALTWQDDHYYLIGNYSKYDNLIHIRVDRMRSVAILGEDIRPFSEVSDYREFFDVADYTKKLFSMHGGELCEIKLRCDRRIIEQVTDRFSEKVFISDVTDDEFSFTAVAALSEALVTFIMNYGKNIRVIAPEELKQMIRSRAEGILSLYNE